MNRLAPVFAILLSLLIGLSSVSLAAMGHGPGGTMLVELCGSETPVLVEIPGAKKENTPPVCPDCLLHLGEAALPQAGFCRPPEAILTALAPPADKAVAGPVIRVAPSARAPPHLI